tara:strand:+ start:1109 stop:1324 length:216 start_codon:yes stop_codon:yes gene_type:complete
MLGVKLPKDLEDALERVAKRTNHTKSYHAKKAIQIYLEDQEDYLDAVAAIEADDGKRHTWEEVQKKLSLND